MTILEPSQGGSDRPKSFKVGIRLTAEDEPLMLPFVAIEFHKLEALIAREPVQGGCPFADPPAGPTQPPIVKVNEGPVLQQRRDEVEDLFCWFSKVAVDIANGN